MYGDSYVLYIMYIRMDIMHMGVAAVIEMYEVWVIIDVNKLVFVECHFFFPDSIGGFESRISPVSAVLFYSEDGEAQKGRREKLHLDD